MKILILIALLGLAISVRGQTKIGSITISDSVGRAYFLDCYNHPDTLTMEYVDGCGEDMEREVKRYNEWLSYSSIRHIVVEVKHPAYIDTSKYGLSIEGYTFTGCPSGSIKHEIPYFFKTITHTPVKGYKGHEKDFVITNREAYIEKVEIGFEVPRKPTEQDFIKWFKKTNSK